MIAYILGTCMPGNEKEVIAKIKEIQHVKEVNGVMGRFDVFVKIEAKDPLQVDGAISKVRNVPQITSTVSMPVMYGQGGTVDDETQ